MQGFAIPQDAKGHAHRPICGLLACAFLTGKTLEEITDHYNTIRKERNPKAREMGKGWKGWSNAGDIREVCKRLGFKHRSQTLNDRTLNHFAKTAPKGWTFAVRVTGHFVTVRDGLIYDQGNPEGVLPSLHRDKRKTAQEIMWVAPVDP